MQPDNGVVNVAAGWDTLAGHAEDTARTLGVGERAVPPAPDGRRGVTAFNRWTFRPVHFFLACRRRWKTLCLLAVVGAVAAAAAVHFLLPSSKAKYSSFALIRVEPADTLPGTPQARSGSRDLRTQAELIKTPFLIRAALQAGPAADLPSVRADADAVVVRLGADLRVEPVGPQILRISLTGSDPAELPVLVDAVKETFLRDVVYGEESRRTKRREFLEAAYRDCEKRLTEKSKALAAVAGPESDEKIAFERFAQRQSELFRLEMNLQRSRVDLALTAQAGGAGAVPRGVAEELCENDPVVRQLRGQASTLDARIARWEQVSVRPESHEPYLALRRSRSAVGGEIDARKQLLLDKFSATATDERDRRLGQARDRVARLDEEEALLRPLLARGWEEFQRAAKEGQASRLQRQEVERLEGIAKQILDELEGLRFGGEAGRTAAVQDAVEPVEKVASRQTLRLGVAAAAPIGLLFLGVLVREFHARHIHLAADVREGLGLRVLGSVPDPARCPAPGPGDGPWPDAVSQSAAAVAAVLLRDTGPAASRVVVVTSAAPGEGKSTLARLLAAAAARTGHSTLLIDGDLYRPTVHRFHGESPTPGLGEVLCGAVGVSRAVRATATERLFVLPAGALNDRAVSLIDRGGIGPILAELRSGFDLIVIDTSPVLTTSHPLLIARHADAVVLAVLAGVSRVPLVEDAVFRLGELRLPLAGVVVNGTAPSSRTYYAPARDRNESPLPVGVRQTA